MEILNLETYFTRSIPEMIKKMARCDFAIGSEHLVQVTHINSPHSFFVRLSPLRYSMKLLERRGPPVNLKELEVGKVVIYSSRIGRRLVRGRIQKVDVCERGLGVFCSILAIDNGWVDTHVLLKYIYEPSEEIMKCGPLAVHCHLDACEPPGEVFEIETINAMKFFVGKYTSKIVIRYKSIEKLKVELRTVECVDDMATILYTLNFTKFYRLQGRPFGMNTYYKYRHRDLEAGDRMHVRVQSGSSLYSFYVSEMRDYMEYDNVIEWYKFTKYCMETPPMDIYTAAEGEHACGVRVANPVRYERAIVKSVTVPGSKALVQLLDWGKEMEANFDDIKPVTCAFLRRPAMAIYCTADQLENADHGVGLRMIYPGLEFMMEILESGNEFNIPHRVRLYPIYIGRSSAFLSARTEEERKADEEECRRQNQEDE